MSCIGLSVVCFFFKQKTAYEMRMSDWSSDVCSSDLEKKRAPQRPFPSSGRNTVFQASLLQAGASVRLGHLDPVQPLRQGACVAALGELDAQAHLVGRVGVAQRVLVGDLAGLVELEQALVEGLHAQVGRFL